MQDDHICIAAAFVPIQVIDRLRLASTHFELCMYLKSQLQSQYFTPKSSFFWQSIPHTDGCLSGIVLIYVF